MKQTISFARKLNNDDTGFYFLGKRKQCNVAMVLLSILARPIDFAEALPALWDAVDAVPRFKDYLRSAPLDTGPPTWCPAKDFHIEENFRHVTLDPGATWADALAVVDRLQTMPFRDGRPPWEMVLINNAPDGKALFMIKGHHALSDGTALALMFAKAFAPEMMENSGVELELVCEAPPSSTVVGSMLRDYGETIISWLRSVRAVGPSLVRTQAIRQREVTHLRQLITPQRRWPGAAYGARRRLSGFRVPAEHWREEARSRGGRTNDLYLAAVASAMRGYWSKSDIDSTPLQIVMPVNVRDIEGVQDGGNVTAVGVVELAGTDRDLERLGDVRRKADHVKSSAPVGDGPGLIAATMMVLPGALRSRLQFREFSTRDIVASNVPMPIPGQLCGVPFEMMFMVAPAIGVAVSFTLTSYGDYLYLACNADLGIIADPGRLDDCIASTLRELFGASVEVLRDGTMTHEGVTTPPA